MKHSYDSDIPGKEDLRSELIEWSFGLCLEVSLSYRQKSREVNRFTRQPCVPWMSCILWL